MKKLRAELAASVLLGAALWAAGCSGTPDVAPRTAGTGAPGGEAAEEPEKVPARVMVTLHEGPPSRWQRTVAELRKNFGLRPMGLWPIESLSLPCVLLEVPPDRDPERLMGLLGRDPRVESVQPVHTFRTLDSGFDDPYADLQSASRELGLAAAHRWATGDGVRVAVVDTGVDFEHPELVDRLVGVQDFVRPGPGRTDHPFTDDIHGTAVAGALAASADNGVGIVGVAPRAELLAVRSCWQEKPGSARAACDSYTLAQGLDFAISRQARVINLSVTGPRDPLLRRIVQAALDRGIPVVAAAEAPREPGFPASEAGVLAVASAPTDEVPEEPPRKRSEERRRPVLTAPGTEILTTVPQEGYDFLSGSSLAAAHVTGVAALLLERAPELGPAQLEDLLRRTARPSNPHSLSVVDACAALAELVGEDEAASACVPAP